MDQLSPTHSEARGPGAAGERLFRLLAETIPEIVLTTTPDGRCDFVNARWESSTGRSREQAIGDGWLELMHPDDRGAFLSRMHGPLERADTFEVELRLLDSAGRYRWFLGRAEPSLDDGARASKWLWTFAAVDDRERSREGPRESGTKRSVPAERSTAATAGWRRTSPSAAQD